jgi:hypothetical protein
MIGTACVQTAGMTAAGATSILVMSPYSVDSTPCKTDVPLKAARGSMVFFLGYDYENLVSCTGKGAGSFESGSSIVSLTLGQLKGKGGSIVSVPAECTFDAAAEAPYFAALSRSKALKLAGDMTFSMFDQVATTDACAGLTFESWIKVDSASRSVAVAYTSEKKSRSESGRNEVQTFVLSVLPQDNDPKGYLLEGNINDKLFRLEPAQSLRVGQWAHVACAYQNLYALRFTGQNYVDFGAAAEFNANDFSLLFHVQLAEVGSSDQLLLSKAVSLDAPAPFQVLVLKDGIVRLRFWPEQDDDSKPKAAPLQFDSRSALKKDEPYKVFISRKLVNAKSKTIPPRQGQLVTVKIWSASGTLVSALVPPSLDTLESDSKGTKESKDLFVDAATAACGPSQPTDASLTLGGSSFAQGIVGQIGGFRIWSTVLEPPDDLSKWKAAGAAKSLVGNYSFTSPEGRVLLDDNDRHHGKLRGEPEWTSSPFSGDAKLSIYINGVRQDFTRATTQGDLLKTPHGPHQLTLGNTIHGGDNFRYFAARSNFKGEYDELRIWEVARSRESICDALCSRLTEVPPEIAVYLPFDKTVIPTTLPENAMVHVPSILDESINCWHLSVVHGGTPMLVPSGAPVGQDASCVTPLLHDGGVVLQAARMTNTRPSVAEYGDLLIGPTGGMEGSFKRAYAFIDPDGRWVLVTGFKIGTLVTEWFSQVQTAPTLIGYVEGAPPIPAENYVSRDDRPFSAIRFVNAQRCSYSYSSRKETGIDVNMTASRGGGVKWQASAGMGVETEVSSGEIKGAVKRVIDISDSSIANEVSTATSHNTMDMRVELTGTWTPRDKETKVSYEPANTGIALVESEVADVFALRLKLQGPVKPLVAYQMRPNPDIPKDRNLVSFRINPFYTKQGCLDGRRGLEPDKAYPQASSGGPPKDFSYFKPAEAYATRDRIRRAEEQLAAEHQRYEFSRSKKSKELPRRNKRNICNSYVWTAEGGTFQETLSTMDFVQLEVGGNTNTRDGLGLSFDMELSISTALVTTNVDALYATHFNLMLTKESNSENSFELQAELPPPIDIRTEDPVTKQLVKRPGAVDTYRWMSFWLAPSVDATAAFFQQVVDPEWLLQSADPK